MATTLKKYERKLSSPTPGWNVIIGSLVILVVAASFLLLSSTLNFITPDAEAYNFLSVFSPSHINRMSLSMPEAATRRGRKSANTNIDRIELSLARARSVIRKSNKKSSSSSSSSHRRRRSSNITALAQLDYVPKGHIYRNAAAFHRSYLEMERVFKIYVYEEGVAPLFHDGPCKSIYSMEGRFINNMEIDVKFRTKDPAKAHVHFLPFSVVEMIRYIYDQDSDHFNIDSIKRTILDYINTISTKYPFWNTSLGSDHFMVSCHDWGPMASTAMTELYRNSIRVLCNANLTEGFDPTKDVSLPEINLKTGRTVGYTGGLSPSKREILAFFAGGLHGPIRPVILEHWKGRDRDIQVYEYLPADMSYEDMMRKSKFCICPSGYEVASPRVVEAIYLECVPVIISNNYSLPFSDVLNWNSFSVQISVEDVPNLKNILTSISQTQYIKMHRRVKLVQRHFMVTTPPKRFDVFYMILHSVWLRRLNVRIHS
ncbi:UDP-Xyl: xylogalacturonan beta-1,3-xylosyltransferase, family GT47 [Zostera marina]|uniref:UDP-Xyl: xylogalacturonan beta-1,3-xylosyltransferase, family GT47 n=1 Tax=Zostera marina TaxID=29655 RepID=A0A0K9PU61_ZOSMR|nr:UDP-Xyl: xylogalacturonan beta-1,3-xylosyltransferase, family GT47 [Zostera marina]